MLAASAVWVLCFHFPAVWTATAIGEGDKPFLDLYGLLASGDAARAGANPFQLNPLDPYQRPLVYTEWWLITAELGLNRADTLWIGWILAGLMLATVVALIQPRTLEEGFATFLWLISPAILMSFQRANNDIVVFAILSAALALMRPEKEIHRLLAVVLFAVAAVIKYYPLAGLIVVLPARSRSSLVSGVLLYALVLCLAWPHLAPGLRSAAQFKPSSEWIHAFGAPVIFRNLGFYSPIGWLLLSIASGALAIWSAYGSTFQLATDSKGRAREREFALGAILIIGCFFLGASYAYKLIFSAWLLPRLWRDTLVSVEAKWMKATGWLLAGTLWLEGIMAVILNVIVAPDFPSTARIALSSTLFISQLLSWALMTCLMRFLVQYVVGSAKSLPLPGISRVAAIR